MKTEEIFPGVIVTSPSFAHGFQQKKENSSANKPDLGTIYINQQLSKTKAANFFFKKHKDLVNKVDLSRGSAHFLIISVKDREFNMGAAMGYFLNPYVYALRLDDDGALRPGAERIAFWLDCGLTTLQVSSKDMTLVGDLMDKF